MESSNLKNEIEKDVFLESKEETLMDNINSLLEQIGAVLLIVPLFVLFAFFIYQILLGGSAGVDETILFLKIVVGLMLSGVFFMLISRINSSSKERKKMKIIEVEKERKLTENPNEPQLAWDLARTKLENYLSRNLSQVRQIFFLSIFVMFIGFGLIIYGSVKVFESPGNLESAMVAAISGVIVNFIGASFLIIYKAIMSQAKDYVTILERINAVGMSVQIIETIEETEENLKDTTKAELAKKLIDLYNK